ncbi:MAG: stage II sporulation protein M, partial [Acidimicrobiia bacterium]
MKIGIFTTERQADWDRLGALIAQARGRPERLAAIEVLELGRLYRSAVADLSRLRSEHPDHPAARQVATLVTTARPLVYRSQPRRAHPIRFMTTTFWRTCAERPVFLVVAASLLLGFAVLGWIWATVDTRAAVGMVPGQFSGALDPQGGTDMGRDLALQAQFSAYLITNNVTVAILSFGVGIFFGIGTVAVLAQNGLLLGVIGGALVAGNNGGFFLELVAAHGVLELSCIIVAAAAGLRLGWAVVHPGKRSRRSALVAEARPAVLMTLGIFPWLVVAGVIESFVSRRGMAA